MRGIGHVMEQLPPSSTQPSRSSREETPVCIAIPQSLHSEAQPRIKRVSAISWLFWSFVFAFAGCATAFILRPYVSADTVSATLQAHLPLPDTPLSLIFLQLLLPCIPTGLLLFAAALTGFSGTLISLVFCVRGFTDGYTFLILAAITAGMLPCPIPASPKNLLILFSCRTVLLWILRLYLSVSARKTAIQYFSRSQKRPTDLRLPMLRHLTRTLAAFLLAALVSLAYGIGLIYFV